ncbi:hypothetical protein ACOHYD_07570 [Desulfobacterota bacterium M19]
MKYQIDPGMRYCLTCHDEYRPEITTCAACGTTLISGAEMRTRQLKHQSRLLARKGEIEPGEEIVTIMKAGIHEVKRIQQFLTRAHIGSVLIGDNTCGQGCCGGDIELRVRTEEAAEALSIIEEDLARTTALHEHAIPADSGFNPEEDEHVCPACGTAFATSSLTCPDCGLCFA